MQETAAPPHASMMVRPSARVRLMPEVWVTVSGWWARERWKRAGFWCDAFCVAEGWKPYEGMVEWGSRVGSDVLWGAMFSGGIAQMRDYNLMEGRGRKLEISNKTAKVCFNARYRKLLKNFAGWLTQKIKETATRAVRDLKQTLTA